MLPRRLALLSALALALLAGPASPASAADPWSLTGALDGGAPSQHTATLLQNGRVLLAGGQAPNPMARARLYDPEMGAWSDTGAMGTARTLHTATALPDGRVLVAGGYGAGPLASAEIYDPATGGWSPTGTMSIARFEHTATPVGGGKVLVTGGDGGPSALASAEVYDPATGAWSPAGDLAAARHTHTATRLPDGDVLVAGGDDGGGNTVASAERYDAATNAWSPAGTMTSPRESHAAAALLDGRILVVGGWSGSFNRVTSAELYDPVAGTWSAIAPMHVGRGALSATTLRDGRVLVAGGDDVGAAEVLDPATGSWENAGRMVTPRFRPTATLLRDGSVLVAGGTMFSATERFALSATFAATPLHFGDRRSGGGATRAYVLVRNLGALRSRVVEATLGGANAGGFAIADDACKVRALAPDASCRIGIDFAPRGDGNRSADVTLRAATGESEVAPLTGTGVPASPATPPRTATASCARAPRKAGVKLRGARCRFSLVGMTGWSTVKAELRRAGKVRAAGRVLGWRGGASLTLAARQRLGRGAYTLVLRPAGRTPVRLRVTLP
ncbi:MAG TPA: kelch repeat-containing protein [Solirubrobacteraceae bacterium]|nr:kelch repeat-containing protein [Solirubrobacteraceae bacterium]